MTPGQLLDAITGVLFVDHNPQHNHDTWTVEVRVEVHAVTFEFYRDDPSNPKKRQHVSSKHLKRDFKAYDLGPASFALHLVQQAEQAFDTKVVQVPSCACGVPLTEPCLKCFPDGDDPCQEVTNDKQVRSG